MAQPIPTHRVGDKSACSGLDCAAHRGPLPEIITGPGYILINGNCMDVLQTLPEDSADAMITDPPYCSGGFVRSERNQDPARKYRSTGASRLNSFGGDSRDPRSFIAWCELWLRHAAVPLKDGGLAALFIDWRQLPVLTDAIQVAGYTWNGLQAWDKGRSARPMNGRYRQQAEFIVSASVGQANKTGKYGFGVFRHTTLTNNKQHITQKPVALMEDLLAPVPDGGTVLDPFMGSGSTGIACLRTGRQFVGIESDPHWFQVAAQRLAAQRLLDESASIASAGKAS